ncbi:MAG: hypothetical protein R2838_15185 [Caldilineaceae bacterium]
MPVCECGEPLRVRARNVRCRHCGKDAPSSLVICPNCGRELKAAPSRWFVWGLPVLLIAFRRGAGHAHATLAARLGA